MKINWKVLSVSLIIVYGVALIGSFFTSPAVNGLWYESIKPSITPPGWVFPIVWNILFFLIAISLCLSWINSKKNLKKELILVFGANFILNITWSIFYFKMQNPLLAFFDLIFLWISIIFMIKITYKINKNSAYMLIPYLLWVSFAGILNWLSI